jgi:hypothetical protein
MACLMQRIVADVDRHKMMSSTAKENERTNHTTKSVLHMAVKTGSHLLHNVCGMRVNCKNDISM